MKTRAVTRGAALMPHVYHLPLTKRECSALLHVIACSEGKTLRPEGNDALIASDLADRILRMLDKGE